MRCANCGVDLIAGSAFCASCGKSTVAGPANATAGLLPENVVGMLCYLGGFITGILFLILEPYKRSRFVRFHAFQSIFVNVAWVVLLIGVEVVTAILPGMLWSVSMMLNSVLSLAIFVLWLVLMYKAYGNERFKLPVLGDLAERQIPEDKPEVPRAAA